ncbi:hypothetical protein [Flavobacterium sp. LHD-85]|uniref:hypothetical protein n=1 Tax=Flavobacterium sp. LHD-85 TaxID=3071410 RepID=UPI0027DEFD9F|nr:hypothetical protein [Flavobacterium sp. LHD-85]MDQ6527675.1 hypothetical protein [Flavobacterium sp. LHD-85]
MKKVIRILAAGAFIFTVYMNANSTDVINSDLNLDNIMQISSANAECSTGGNGMCRLLTSGQLDCLATYEWSKNNCK